MSEGKPIRLCEWGSVEVGLDAERRMRLDAAAETWRAENRLPVAPLAFGGPTGTRLSARQYVGVIEVDGISVEIYPKLDRALVTGDGGSVSAFESHAVMRNLLWILEVSGFVEAVRSDTASLAESPLHYPDLFAYLMAGVLLRQMEAGLAHAYVPREDDLAWVRGRILLEDQLSRNWMRPDRIACAWDEFTPDTFMNRLFKCACRTLARYARHPVVLGLLSDCVWMLDEVEDVDPATALHEAERITWDRRNERFRDCFDVARRLLSGMCYDLAVGGARTFVFLLDMNRVFELYAQRVLEAALGVSISAQTTVGTLMRRPHQRIHQVPDYQWHEPDGHWIADAKYKFLFQDNPLPLPDGEDPEAAGESAQPSSLSAGDLRQLTVYAELYRRRSKLPVPVRLMVVYPYADQGSFKTLEASTELWNGSSLHLVPILMRKPESGEARGAAPPELRLGWPTPCRAG